MIVVQEHHDALLRLRLESLAEVGKDYWSFKGNSRRNYGHGLFQYPARMVPQVSEAILMQACFVHPSIERVDAFDWLSIAASLPPVLPRRLTPNDRGLEGYPLRASCRGRARTGGRSNTRSPHHVV